MKAASKLKQLAVRLERAVDSKKYHRAVKIAHEVINLGDNITGHFYLCLCYQGLGKFEIAKKHAETVLRLNSEEPNAWLNLGVVMHQLGNDTRALRCYGLELKHRPESFEAHFNIAQIYFERRQYKKAHNHFSKCWKGKHCRHLIGQDLAWTAFKTKDRQLERAVYNHALKEDPLDAWALNNLGSLFHDEGNYVMAVRKLEQARVLDKSNRMIMRNLGRSLLCLGEQFKKVSRGEGSESARQQKRRAGKFE